jgi:hypothetical protein
MENRNACRQVRRAIPDISISSISSRLPELSQADLHTCGYMEDRVSNSNMRLFGVIPLTCVSSSWVGRKIAR